MHVLLVGPDFESNLSLGYLASSLRAAGHAATIAAFNERGDAGEVMRQAAGADLIGLSMCFQVRAPEFLALAAELKRARPERPVIAGGHFATCAAGAHGQPEPPCCSRWSLPAAKDHRRRRHR